jgi:hypothetical protein
MKRMSCMSAEGQGLTSSDLESNCSDACRLEKELYDCGWHHGRIKMGASFTLINTPETRSAMPNSLRKLSKREPFSSHQRDPLELGLTIGEE